MAIMISIQPQWVSKILNGEKTIEIRKNCPKEWKDYLGGKTKVKPNAVKVYIYCTKGNKNTSLVNVVQYGKSQGFYNVPNDVLWRYNDFAYRGTEVVNGKVVACFTLNEVTEHLHNYIDFEDEECYNFLDEDVKNAGFKTDLEGLLGFDRFVRDYGKGKPLYAWHIDGLKIYDVPRELREFRTLPCDKPENACRNCKYLEVINTPNAYETNCYVMNGKPLTRPFKSWGYCEELEEEI